MTIYESFSGENLDCIYNLGVKFPCFLRHEKYWQARTPPYHSILQQMLLLHHYVPFRFGMCIEFSAYNLYDTFVALITACI